MCTSRTSDREGVRQARFYRNLLLLHLDQQRYSDRVLQKLFLMRDNMHLVRYALRDNAGLSDANVRQKCQQVVDLYRTLFLTPRLRRGVTRWSTTPRH